MICRKCTETFKRLWPVIRSFTCHQIHKHRLTIYLWSLIGHSVKTSSTAAAGDSGSGKRDDSGAYKIEGVIY